MRLLYPQVSCERITAVFNRIWHGPQIIYHMMHRIRIELPTGRHGASSAEVENLYLHQRLWAKAEVPQRLTGLKASKKFGCSFPRPNSGQMVEWCAGFHCVVKTIDRAAERLDFRLGSSKTEKDFW